MTVGPTRFFLSSVNISAHDSATLLPANNRCSPFPGFYRFPQAVVYTRSASNSAAKTPAAGVAHRGGPASLRLLRTVWRSVWAKRAATAFARWRLVGAG